MKAKRTKVFISYSHRDRTWLERILIHLKPLIRDKQMQVWADTSLRPGAKWRDEIKIAIDSAKVAILLVSADFLASDFIAENELPPLLKAAQDEGAIIMPLIISPCRFNQIESISQFQALNDPIKPLDKLSRTEKEHIYASLAERVIEALALNNNEDLEESTIVTKSESEKVLISNSSIVAGYTLTSRENLEAANLPNTGDLSRKITKKRMLILLAALLACLFIYYSFPYKQEIEVMTLKNGKATMFGVDLEIKTLNIVPDDNQNYTVTTLVSSPNRPDLLIQNEGTGYMVTYDGVNRYKIEIVGIDQQKVKYSVERKKWGVSGW